MIMVFLSVNFIILLCTAHSKIQLADCIPKIYPCFLFYRFKHLPEVQIYCCLPRNFLSLALVPDLPGIPGVTPQYSSTLNAFIIPAITYRAFLNSFSLPGNKGDPGSRLISKDLHDVWHETQHYHLEWQKLVCSLDLT